MGSIKVRCAVHRLTLWFHFDFLFAADFLHPDFRTDGRDKEINELLRLEYPWDQLTELGHSITRRILRVKGVRALSARPHYFSVEVKREKDWPFVLREVVRIIREESRDQQAPVEAHPGSAAEQWHLPLLRQLS